MVAAQKLAGKVALITGAGRGIGRAIALAYAAEGARLALTARSADELEQTRHLIEQAGGEAWVWPADVADRAQVERLVAAAVQHFGRLDILVNNAGVEGPIGPLETNDPEHWAQTIAVNLNGVYHGCRAVIPAMQRQGGGRIINLSGAGGNNGWAHMSAYCASKAAVVRLTEVLALELQDSGISVNALGPGSVHTDMWERMTAGAEAAGAGFIHETGLRVTAGGGAPIEQCAELAVWLAGDESAGLSGRLISAVADDFRALPPRIPEIMAGPAYQLRLAGLP